MGERYAFLQSLFAAAALFVSGAPTARMMVRRSGSGTNALRGKTMKDSKQSELAIGMVLYPKPILLSYHGFGMLITLGRGSAEGRLRRLLPACGEAVGNSDNSCTPSFHFTRSASAPNEGTILPYLRCPINPYYNNPHEIC